MDPKIGPKLVLALKTRCKDQSDRSNYSSKDTAGKLLLCMGEVLKDKLKKTLKNMLRVVEDKNPVETFLSIVKIPNGKAESIANAIHKELTDLCLNYDSITTFEFDGASNIAGKVGGVRKRLSEEANKEVLYIHCKTHILSLAAAS